MDVCTLKALSSGTLWAYRQISIFLPYSILQSLLLLAASLNLCGMGKNRRQKNPQPTDEISQHSVQFVTVMGGTGQQLNRSPTSQ